MKHVVSTALAALVLALPSCKKETAATRTLKQQLIGKKWRCVYHATNGVALDKWCTMNSIFEFTDAGSLYITEGDNNGACTPNNIGSISKQTFSTDANDTYFLIPNSFPTKNDTFEVVLISSTEMRTRRWANVHTNLWEERYTAD